MTKLVATVVAGILIAGATIAAEEHPHHPEQAKEAKIVPQTTCPVMGGKVNKALYVDHDGKRIYVCCKGCIDAVKKDPQKYIKKLEADGVTVAKLQTTCPVMGGKINKELYVDHDGKRVYVCCKGCIGAVQKEPEKYIKKLEAAGVALEPAPKDEATKEDAHGGHGAHEGHHH
jgi:YHS domain-containing protein